MEPTEFRPNNEKHPVQGNRILPPREKAWIHPKTHSNLRGLIKIRFQNGFVKYHDARHDKCMVSGVSLALNFIVDILFRSPRFCLQALERECGADIMGRVERGGDIVSPCEIKIEEFEEGRVGRHNLKDELSREGFVAKTLFEFTQDLLVRCVFRVEHGREGGILASYTNEKDCEIAYQDD